MKRFGLLGRTLKHSYSPQIHEELCGEYEYKLYEKEPDEVENFAKTTDLDGFNVTIPYKEVMLTLCDEVSNRAVAIGCVNTVLRKDDGTLYGDNTDAQGFLTLLKFGNIDVKGKNVMVLGGGGSSRTVKFVCAEEGAKKIVVISRTGEYNYDNLHLNSDAEIIVNTTPVGMFPKNGNSPISLSDFPKCTGVVDLIYNPSETALVLEAKRRNISAVSGLMMLISQGRVAAEKFCGHEISRETELKTYNILQTKMRNILLIGMPGCGKSTIGKMLAATLSREFTDSDALIAEKCGAPTHVVLTEKGEPYFRSVETQVLSEVCKHSSLVISTGGGCITIPENYDILKQNSIVIFIERELKLLPKKNRPISQKANMSELYAKRLPLYRKFADFSVLNNHTLQKAVDEILLRLTDKG